MTKEAILHGVGTKQSIILIEKKFTSKKGEGPMTISGISFWRPTTSPNLMMIKRGFLNILGNFSTSNTKNQGPNWIC
jgi:hypothetical protein